MPIAGVFVISYTLSVRVPGRTYLPQARQSSQGATHLMEFSLRFVPAADLISISLGFLATLAITTVLYEWYYRSVRLSTLPNVGVSLGLLQSKKWTAQKDFFFNAKEILGSGYAEYSSKGRSFLVESATPPRIIISRDHLEALRHKPEGVLSHRHTISERFMGYWTGLDVVEQSTVHNEICQNTLVQDLPCLVEAMYEEAAVAFKLAMPINSKDGDTFSSVKWQSVNASETIFTIISRINSRILVGPEICRNSAWLAICKSYPQDVIAVAEILRPFPAILRPFIYLFSRSGKKLRKHAKIGRDLLLPLIDKRRLELDARKSEADRSSKAGDILQWLLEQSKGKEAKSTSIVSKVLFLTMAGFHASTMQGTHTVLDLSSRPSLVTELRDEINEQLDMSGGKWSTKLLHNLWKMDSVLKESQRLHPPGLLGFNRRIRSPVALPNNQILPPGGILAAPIYHIAQDPTIWPDPKAFQALRFYEYRMASMKEKNADDFQQQFASPDNRIMGFGFGRYACPGRVFAATQLKLVLGLIVRNFVIRLPSSHGTTLEEKQEDRSGTEPRRGESVFPQTLFFGEATVPNPTISFEYRGRESS